MQNAINATSKFEGIVEIPFSSLTTTELSSFTRDTAFYISGTRNGRDSSYPVTPVSQRLYEGDRPFEDGVPWS
jgi:hypothetical protein